MRAGKCVRRRWVALLLGAAVACGPPQPDKTVEDTGGEKALGREVRPWSQHLSMLEGSEVGTTEKVAAIEALGDSVVDALKEVHGPLVDALGDPSRDVALAAESTIRRIQDDIADALIAASEEPRRGKRGRLRALHLLRGRTVSKAGLDELAELMRAGEDWRRRGAVRVAGILAAENPGALDVLRTGMVDAATNVRIEALEAVATAGRAAAPLVEEVSALLGNNETAAVKEAACFALAALGASAKSAVPALERTVRDSDGRLARAARGALQVID